MYCGTPLYGRMRKHERKERKSINRILEDSPSIFIYPPKPIRLIHRILAIAADKDSLVLDSFAGSGTTGHAVLDLNKADGGNRRFILVEMEESICQPVTAQRLTRQSRATRMCQRWAAAFGIAGLVRPSSTKQGTSAWA